MASGQYAGLLRQSRRCTNCKHLDPPAVLRKGCAYVLVIDSPRDWVCKDWACNICGQGHDANHLNCGG